MAVASRHGKRGSICAATDYCHVEQALLGEAAQLQVGAWNDAFALLLRQTVLRQRYDLSCVLWSLLCIDS
jgi:hypothetical protein